MFDIQGNQIASELLPPNSRPSDPSTLLQPILSAYSNVSYNNLETAIFPSFFHGKCQRFSKDGQDPPGCPDPDCPVVCGTPGSMVHFYSTLRFIAFNSTSTTMETLMKPGSDAFSKVETLVKAAGGHASKRDLNDESGAPVSPRYARAGSHLNRAHARHFGNLKNKHQSREDLECRSGSLASILAQFGPLLAKACGGTAKISDSGLPNCSWETAMRSYILSFP